ncbi:MAG: threonine ammonia-lyase IlvA [Bacteroidetes bacterium]|nr:threonine ammonia-lyase IlvA [Bacteroidota bacterium]
MLERIKAAHEKLKGVVTHTPLMHNLNLSGEFDAKIYLKREDLQVVRSYKIRGAYNKISSLTKEELKSGIVCASAGNHAQGVAYSCNLSGIKGVIFMPVTTPKQKIKQVKLFGKEQITISLVGDAFDDAYRAALLYSEQHNCAFIHPFDDDEVIAGQGTVGLEILEDVKERIDYLFIPIGGGGLAAGVSSVFKKLSPETKIIGVQPEGAPSMYQAMKEGMPVTLDSIESFVDGASVKRSGEKTFEICKQTLDDIVLVPEGKVCTTILKLYNEEAMVVEPAGALTISALDLYKEKIKGKNVVCIVSGGNNDIVRTEEIKERSLLYEGLKHYFIIRFPQRAGALREFVVDVLGPNDNITYFEYSKKNNREVGPAVVGLELNEKASLEVLLNKMKQKHIVFEYINDKPELFEYIT